jgi:hypothetical protein
VDPLPDPLLGRESGSAGNRTRDLWVCTQEVWPLDHRGGLDVPTAQEDVTRRRFHAVLGGSTEQYETRGDSSTACPSVLLKEVNAN